MKLQDKIRSQMRDANDEGQKVLILDDHEVYALCDRIDELEAGNARLQAVVEGVHNGKIVTDALERSEKRIEDGTEGEWLYLCTWDLFEAARDASEGASK